MPDRDMLINFLHGEECRIAFTEDGRLDELYTERTSADLHVGNIYRGKVTNVEASIQAAFIDFGLERSGFLHITDLHPRYFTGQKQEDTERVGMKTPRRERPPIQQCLRRGQEILVQVLKEGLGSKGPTLTSYLSIPGRFLVMMPNMERHGVSRKIEDPEKRRQIHKILDELDPPEGFGFIVRTAGLDRPKAELKRDLAYLLRLWKDIEARMKSGRGPTELYTESDLIIRTLRDVLTTDVERVIVDDRTAALRAKHFLRIAMPRTAIKVIHYAGGVPLFDAFGIEEQIATISARHVPLKNGGGLVFDQTEAMVTIDVNSGKFRDNKDAEQTAYMTNMEAVDEIARQLRLRDLGGLIILDLIDMYATRHRRDVEKKFKDNLKNDRARTKPLPISELGMLEMTRQRMRPSLKKSVYHECPACKGLGQVMSPESVALDGMRRLAVALSYDKVQRIEVAGAAEALTTLFNRKREAILRLGQTTGKAIEFRADITAGPDALKLTCFDTQNAEVDATRLPKPKTPTFTDADEITTPELEELETPEYENEEIETEVAAEPESTTDAEPEPREEPYRHTASMSDVAAAAPRHPDDTGAESKIAEPRQAPQHRQRPQPPAAAPTPGESQQPMDPNAAPKRRRRRRGRRGRGGGGGQNGGQGGENTQGQAPQDSGEGVPLAHPERPPVAARAPHAPRVVHSTHAAPSHHVPQSQPLQGGSAPRPPQIARPPFPPRPPAPPRAAQPPRPPHTPAPMRSTGYESAETPSAGTPGQPPRITQAEFDAQDIGNVAEPAPGENAGGEGGEAPRRRRRRGGRRRGGRGRGKGTGGGPDAGGNAPTNPPDPQADSA
jgi:ribonuclease E